MKVLHVTSGIAAALGGPTTAALQMCQALTKTGMEVTLLSTDLAERGSFMPFYRPSRLSDADRQALSKYQFEIVCCEVQWPTRFCFSPQMRETASALMANVDLVHIHSIYAYTGLMVARLARGHGIPYVVSPHGSFMPHLRKRSRLAKSIYHRTLAAQFWNGAAGLLYTSETERDDASSLGIVAPAKVVPLGLDLGEFDHMPPKGSFRRPSGLDGQELVVFLGRLAPRKGLDILLKAFAQICPGHPKAHLVLAGPDEFGYRRALEQEINRLGLAGRVTMPGLIVGHQKLALLSDADLWVLPSYGENFGLAALEALASGCPVVLSDRVDLGRELRDQRAVAICECDTESLAAIITKLLDSRAERDELGAAGKVASRSFSWDSRIPALVEAYRSANGKV